MDTLLLMAEIRRSPVEVGSLSHYLQGFIHPRWCKISAINNSKHSPQKLNSSQLPPTNTFIPKQITRIFQNPVHGVFSGAISDFQGPIRSMYGIFTYTLPKTNSSPLKMDGWNTTFLLGRPIFRGVLLLVGKLGQFRG